MTETGVRSVCETESEKESKKEIYIYVEWDTGREDMNQL